MFYESKAYLHMLDFYNYLKLNDFNLEKMFKKVSLSEIIE